jgi:hypothetical protein
MGYFHKENVFLDGLIFLVLFGGIVAIFLSLSLLLNTKYTDFTCIRSLGHTECILVRTFQFSKSSEIKIHNPVAVDLSECDKQDIFGKTYSSTRCGNLSSADIRSKDVSYKINIYSGQDRQAVRAVAKEINEFLLSSNAPSFHKRF